MGGPMGAATCFAWTLSQFGKDGHQITFWSLAAMCLIMIGVRTLPAYVDGHAASAGPAKIPKSPKPKRDQSGPKAAVIGTKASIPSHAPEEQESLKNVA